MIIPVLSTIIHYYPLLNTIKHCTVLRGVSDIGDQPDYVYEGIFPYKPPFSYGFPMVFHPVVPTNPVRLPPVAPDPCIRPGARGLRCPGISMDFSLRTNTRDMYDHVC